MFKMSDSDDAGEFLCNLLIIKALLHFLPFTERKKAQEWLVKLQGCENGVADAKTRNEYAFYLLINVQNGTMSQPFNKAPPTGKLRPLCRILPDYLYEDVMKQLKISYCRLNKMLNDSDENYDVPELESDPGSFQSQQPRPRKGVMAHCAVFSDYGDDTKPMKYCA